MQILVADDSPTNLAIITAALEKLGHNVIAVQSGQTAIDTFLQNRPDLIILDVVMKGMDGFECARRVREIITDDWIPIIFLSANVDDRSIAKGIDAGGDDYLTKPFSEVTLAAKVKAMQRIADMRQKLFETTQKLYQLSSTDALTSIYNRLQFDRSIKEIYASATRNHYTIALLFIDLDNFKTINDTFGHHIGDLLLVEVARRLKLSIRANDFIARLGGDEFAIILGELNSPEDAENIAKKILLNLEADYHLEDHHIRAGASIGIALYDHPSITQETLMLNADIAMYHAKASGRNNYQFFSEVLHDKYKKQINIEHALKFAIERGELFLTYQPIFDLQTKDLAGLEVLLNWEHPTLGIVTPNVFLPLAEDIGLIHHIGDWVFKKFFQQVSKWSLPSKENFKLAINLSSRQLLQENFYNNLSSLLTEFSFNPKQLNFELIETIFMSHSSQAFKDILDRLHKLGIGFAIDDFGTGYSSLIRLKHLPINTLKIDKIFIQDAVNNPNSAIIVSCLIALGKNLNLNVIAEGIETEAQLAFLINKKCPQGQGYFLSKPLTTTQMNNFLAQYKENLTQS